MRLPFIFILFFCFYQSQAQKSQLGLKLDIGGTITAIKDKNIAPSGATIDGFAATPGDGETKLVKNGTSVALAFTLDVPFDEKVYVATALKFYFKSFTLSNRDASYYGESTYSLAFLQIPLTAKIYVKDINEQIRLFARFGPTIDIKLKESLVGGDGAHFWNMANNDRGLDPYRGMNGDNRPMPLFRPLNIGLLLGFGGEYKVSEELVITGALNFNPSFMNMINPNLRLNDFPRTPVAENLKIYSSVIAFEIGAAFLF